MPRTVPSASRTSTVVPTSAGSYYFDMPIVVLPVILSTVGVATGASGSAVVLKAVGLLSFPSRSFAMAVKASLAVAVPAEE